MPQLIDGGQVTLRTVHEMVSERVELDACQ